MELTYRPRRLRRTPALRAMVREHSLSAADFIYPLFDMRVMGWTPSLPCLELVAGACLH